MGYEPAKVPAVIPLSSSQRAHDTQLRAVPKRLVHITRPVDLFLHQLWTLERSGSIDPDVLELGTAFAELIRDQLSATASKVNAMRIENVRNSQGAGAKSDNLDLVEPGHLQDDVKSAQSLARTLKEKPTQRFHKASNSYSSQKDYYSSSNNGYRRSHQNNIDDHTPFRRDSNHRWGDNNNKRQPRQRGRSHSRHPRRRESEEDSLSS
ncbi:hypothetical protein BGZ73_002081 [Actinomortierella ambigua]|nr:hypothetical protein BGZ73_002081 [Actinomortierella ambigua]